MCEDIEDIGEDIGEDIEDIGEDIEFKNIVCFIHGPGPWPTGKVGRPGPSQLEVQKTKCYQYMKKTHRVRVRGVSEEIDFLGLHLDTKTHIASQWDGCIDSKTTYNHFLNIKLKGTIGLPSAPLRFAWPHTGGHGPSTRGELAFSTAPLKSHEPNCQACLHSAKDTTQPTITSLT